LTFRISIFFALLLSILPLSAQLPFGPFDDEFTTLYISVDDGMESAYRKEMITEDLHGNIWLTTNNGVLRYDGFQCMNFTNFLKDKFPEKVKVDQERVVLADSLGQIWMGGAKGLSVYNLAHGTYEKVFLSPPKYKEDFRNTVIRFFVFHGQLYVGTENGLFIVDMTTHEVIKAYKTNGPIHPSRNHTDFTVQGVYPHLSDSLIYLQLNDGMHIINTKINRESLITTCELPGSEAGAYGRAEHWFHQGVVFGNYIIAGSWGTGITHFDMEREVYEVFLPNPKQQLTPNPNIFKDAKAINDSIIFLPNPDFGLFYYEFPERKLTRFEGTPSGLHHLGMIDSYGHYWIGSTTGLYRSNRQFITLENIEKIDLEEYQDNLTVYISFTQSYDLPDILYQYRLDDNQWESIDNNILKLYNISGGNHDLEVRAQSGDIQFSKHLSLYRFVPWYKRWYNILMITLLISGILYLVYRWRLKQELEKERIKSDYELKISQLNTSALRSRMNPHFLFNTLNSIKHHALFKDKEETGEYITDFSQLIRGILEYSDRDFISLSEDIEWMKNYINIENRRFRNPFAFSLRIDQELDLDKLRIPPLLIQPYVENAIWHGLQYKKDTRKLTIRYDILPDGYSIEIIDNGVGRSHGLKKIAKSQKKSLGMKITKDRINQINQNKNANIEVTILDLYDHVQKPSGTNVYIKIKNVT